jgi:hypothetical protein
MPIYVIHSIKHLWEVIHYDLKSIKANFMVKNNYYMA